MFLLELPTKVSALCIDFMRRHGSLHTLIGWYVPMSNNKIIRVLFCFFSVAVQGNVNTGISPITGVRLQPQFLFKCDTV